MITLNVEPNTSPLTWEDFIGTKPPFSIALDGYVSAGPKFFQSKDGPYENFNHHEEVSRLETRATCAQAFYSVRLGLYKFLFKTMNGEPHSNLYVNDCDHDVCLSCCILRNPHIVEGDVNPRLHQLVHMEDLLDTMSGAYQFPAHLPAIEELNWVFYPYDHFRVKGGLRRRKKEEFEQVIDEVEKRILDFIDGRGQTMELDTSYYECLTFPTWRMVHEIGSNARIGLFRDGINAFVTLRALPNKRFIYSIGRWSNWIPFPIPRIIEQLNIAENSADDRWGGSPTIGGSPRVNGSKLLPMEVAEIINRVLASM